MVEGENTPLKVPSDFHKHAVACVYKQTHIPTCLQFKRIVTTKVIEAQGSQSLYLIPHDQRHSWDCDLDNVALKSHSFLRLFPLRLTPKRSIIAGFPLLIYPHLSAGREIGMHQYGLYLCFLSRDRK